MPVPVSCRSKQYPAWRRYGDRGYVFGYIVGFDGMDSGQIVAQVVEGKVSVSRPCISLHRAQMYVVFLPWARCS